MVKKLVLAVLLGGMAALACRPAQAGEEPPKLIRVDGPIRIMDPHRWLFAVPDGEPAVVLSAERNRELLIGRLDVSKPMERVAWEVALTGSDVGTTGIDGHWHLFAHDAHWIVVSTPVGSFLLKLDRNLKRLGLFPVVAAADPDAIPTGDMFMVAEPNGVAIGHFLPEVGHRVFRIDTEGQIYKTVAFGGFPFLHSNGASAELTVDGFLVLAPMTLDPRGESPVSVFWTDADWQILSGAVALSEWKAHIAMATVVSLPSGYRIVTARVRDVTGEPNVPPWYVPSAPPWYRPGAPSVPDDGAIVRYLVRPSFEIVKREVLLEGGGNRPHMARFGDLLLTTWDTPPTNEVWLRIDRIVE